MIAFRRVESIYIYIYIYIIYIYILYICKGYNTARGLYHIYKNRGPRGVARVITNLFHDEATLFLMCMRAFVPLCYNNPQAVYSFSKVLWFCQLYPRESSLLGMEKENIPPTKKAKVSLSLKKSRKPQLQPVSEDKFKGALRTEEYRTEQ